MSVEVTVEISNEIDVDVELENNEISVDIDLSGPTIIQIIEENMSSLLIDYITTESVTKYDPVTSNGKVADSNIISHRGKMIGIATETIGNGFGSQAWSEGEITNTAWNWIVGAIIYLNGTSLSMTPPTEGSSVYSQIVGTAIKTDTIDLDIKQSYQF